MAPTSHAPRCCPPLRPSYACNGFRRPLERSCNGHVTVIVVILLAMRIRESTVQTNRAFNGAPHPETSHGLMQHSRVVLTRQCPPTGVPRLYETAPPEDPSVGLCPWKPWGAGLFLTSEVPLHSVGSQNIPTTYKDSDNVGRKCPNVLHSANLRIVGTV